MKNKKKEDKLHWADEKEVIHTNIPLKLLVFLFKMLPSFFVLFSNLSTGGFCSVCVFSVFSPLNDGYECAANAPILSAVKDIIHS